MAYTLILGDTLETLRTLESESVQCCITSPPYYGLRDYGFEGQLGQEPTVKEYLDSLIEIFSEVKRVLKPDGACWVNLGDSYFTKQNHNRNGISSKQVLGEIRGGGEYSTQKRLDKFPPKTLMQIPARFSLRMTDELGFILRNQVIWHKPGPMPSSARDRFTVDFEPVFFFVKQRYYKFNPQLEPAANPGTILKLGDKSFSKAQATGSNSKPVGNALADTYEVKDIRNKRTTWTISFEKQKIKHYASYPTKLITPMVLSTTDPGDTILDPFNGTATTGVVALNNGRDYIGIDLKPEYIEISEQRLSNI